MLCEICKNNPATMHSVTIINGEREEHAFCQQCAARLQAQYSASGSWDFMSEFFPSMVNMLFDFYDMPESYVLAGAPQEARRIPAGGRGGYGERKLTPAQEKQLKLERLREQLAAAVHEERYEDAAKLRDEISQIQSKAGDSE